MAGCVENAQINLLVAMLDHARVCLQNCGWIALRKFACAITDYEAGLAHRTVANEHQFDLLGAHLVKNRFPELGQFAICVASLAGVVTLYRLVLILACRCRC